MTAPGTTREWDADVVLSADDARRLIEDQFPELAPAALEPLGVGWDNWAYRVDGALVFRFPRRRIAERFLAGEASTLPHLADRLPLPVPFPAFRGAPAGGYPYPFVGYRHLPGRTACGAGLTDEQRAANAAPLGRFLRALHTTPLDGALDAVVPGDEIRRADMALRLPRLAERVGNVRAREPDFPGDALLARAERLAATPPWTGPPVLCHGDLYARHLLVDADGALCGVIDWGDVHRGDPAVDLAIVPMFLPPAARPVFEDAYGPIDPPTRDRALFRALFYSAVLLDYGLTEGDAGMEAAGRAALRLSSAPAGW